MSPSHYSESRSYGSDSYSKSHNLRYSDSRSRSRSRDRRYSPPSSRRRSPSHDDSRTPPRGPAADNMRRGANTRDWDRDRDQRRDRDDQYRTRSSPSPHRGRDNYRLRDERGYRSPGYNSRSQSASRSRSRRRKDRSPNYGGPPSKEVIMEGLPVDMVEDDISKELSQYSNVEGLDDVRVIRDRQTTYSREKEDRAREKGPEWICLNCNTSNYSTRSRCFKCHAPKAEYEAPLLQTKANFANNGDSDVSPDSTPSQFLLIRGLEPTTTEEILAKGVSKLYKPATSASQSAPSSKKGFKVSSTTGDANLGAKEGSLRRVLLVHDRWTDDSWRYGFAEFATVDDAQAALVRYNSFEKFTISSKPVMTSYIHAGVFVPVLNPNTSTENFTFSPLANPAMKLAYWDENAYVKEFMTLTGAESIENSNGPSEAKKDKSTSQATDGEGLVKVGKEGEKQKKRKAESGAVSSVKKSAPSHLQFWTSRHAELHGIDHKDTSSAAASQPDSEQESNELKHRKRISPPSDVSPPTQSFADLDRKCCLLCSRQFKTEAEVNKHERLSQLHRDNLGNEDLVKKASAKLAKLGIQPLASDASASEYRDRARERRRQHNLPTKAKPTLKKSRSPTPEQPQSKGAALLSKMGYEAGSGLGLGASNTGIAVPISTDVYAPGVGLGAEGGKRGDAVREAELNTKDGNEGYRGFLERTREGARDRYERMAEGK